MVRELTSGADFQRAIRSGKLVVVDFTATWCGPCRMVAPKYEDLSRKYPDVEFYKVVEEQAGDIIQSEGIRAFPTFKLYHNAQLLEEIQGADIAAVETAIIRHRARIPASFSGTGASLGGSGAANAADAREARLRRLGLDPNAPTTKPPAPPSSSSAPPPAPAPMDVDDQDDEAILAQALKLSQGKSAGGEASDNVATAAATATSSSIADNVQMVEPDVDTALLAQLLEFGFSELRAKKGLLNGGGNIEGAVQWITEHQEDADIDAPIPLVAQLDMTAFGGGKRKLTAEELQARLEARRKERAEEERQAEIAREKARRESGKSIGKTKEELDRLQRQREAEAKKREKDAFKAERERLRAEIARDKAERAARNGTLPGRLDAEGYNPAGLQGAYGAGSGSSSSASAERKPSVDEGTPSERADKAIGLVSRQKIAGSGGAALKVLTSIVKNIANDPSEDKFRNLNAESAALKTKVAPVVGALMLLKAVGFEKDEAENKWVLAADKVDVGLLTDVRAKLEAALAAYTPA